MDRGEGDGSDDKVFLGGGTQFAPLELRTVPSWWSLSRTFLKSSLFRIVFNNRHDGLVFLTQFVIALNGPLEFVLYK